MVPPPQRQQQTRLQQLFLNSSHIINSSHRINNNIIDDTICSISSSTPFPSQQQPFHQQQRQPFQQQQQQQNIQQQQQQHQITVTNFNQAVLRPIDHAKALTSLFLAACSLPNYGVKLLEYFPIN